MKYFQVTLFSIVGFEQVNVSWEEITFLHRKGGVLHQINIGTSWRESFIGRGQSQHLHFS